MKTLELTAKTIADKKATQIHIAHAIYNARRLHAIGGKIVPIKVMRAGWNRDLVMSVLSRSILRQVGHVKSHAAQYGGSCGSYPAVFFPRVACDSVGVPAEASAGGSAVDSHWEGTLAMTFAVATACGENFTNACRLYLTSIIG